MYFINALIHIIMHVIGIKHISVMMYLMHIIHCYDAYYIAYYCCYDNFCMVHIETFYSIVTRQIDAYYYY